MALQFVGQTSGTGTSNNYTVSLNGTLTGGIASSPSVDDIVIVISAFGNTASSAPAVSGDSNGAYVGLHAALHVNDTWDTEFRSFYEVQVSVDTTLTVTRTTNAAYGGATVVQVWRGVDIANPIDVTTVTSTITNGSRVGFAAVTPVTAGAVIIAGAAGTQGTTGSAFTAPSNMTSANSVKADGTTSDIGVLSAYYDAWTSGAFTPNAITGGTTSTSSSGASSTIVLRPFVAVTHDTDGTLTGQIGSVTGSANHISVHSTTGALTADIGAISGSATRYRQFASSGVLTGQGSTVTGDADREPFVLPHTTEGTLVGQGATVDGSATRFRVFSTSGVLAGQEATITGDADHEGQVVPHVIEGTLTGQGAVVTGDITRYRQFASSGTLVGQSSVITGDASNFTVFDTTGDLTGQGSALDGNADHESSFHDSSGELTGSGAFINGNARGSGVTTTAGGRSRKVALIIVEVDGVEYRVPETQLEAFLEALKEKAEQSKPVKKKRKKAAKNEPAQIEIMPAPKVQIKSAPVELVAQIQNKLDAINDIMQKAFSKKIQQYIQQQEDVAKTRIIKKQRQKFEEDLLLMIL